ncbi:MAG: protease modulator HflC [Oceanicaulis sp.]
MKVLTIIIGVLVGAAVIAFATATYTVSETQSALVLRFGDPVRVTNEIGDDDPGLHLKLPWEDVLYFDRRNVEFDMRPQQLQAGDQERLEVDAFLRYRVVNPLRFFQTVRTEEGARARLSTIMENALRAVVGSIPSQDVISGQRAELMDRVEASVDAATTRADLGVEVIDVRILRADLPDEVEERVFQRMRSEREQEASRIRAVGEERAREIRAAADRQATVILANARAEADRIRGEGDAQRNRIYAQAYGQDEEFFQFYRSMIAYENALRDGTPIVVPPDSEFFQYFRSERGGQN